MTESFRIIEKIDVRTWDDFVAARGGHILQSAAWGDLKSRFGWSARRVALECDARIVAGAQILFRPLAPGLTLAYIPRGPVVDPADKNTATTLFDALCATAKSHGAFALKVEPNSLTPSPLPSMGEEARPSAGIQPRITIHVDLTRDLDTILAQMKPKWRYNIRLAERKGVVVRAGNADDLATFYRLMQTTGERDHFVIHSFEYYRAAYDLLAACDYAHVFIAEYQREPLAAIFVTAFGGEAIYLYGASGNSHREKMPNHALHWAAMQWAKVRGCSRYDLWGVPDVGAQHVAPLPDGLYQFKQGFGGAVVHYAGAYDVVFSRMRYALYIRALAMRRGGVGWHVGARYSP